MNFQSHKSLITYLSNHLDILPWLNACTFMLAAYGSEGNSISITMEHNNDYDDEYYYHSDACTIASIVVLNRNDQKLDPNLSLPYCQQILTQYQKDVENCYICSEEEDSNGDEGHVPERSNNETDEKFIERLFCYREYWPIKPTPDNQMFFIDQPPDSITNINVNL